MGSHGAEEGGDVGDGAERCSYALEEVHAALELVRGFDPPGIACSSLPESLLRQMDARGIPVDALVRRMVLEAWDLFLRRQFPAVAKRLGVELAALEAELEIIKSLETHRARRLRAPRG
jgi:DNA-directed RNA polymerase specialized sigma54-like protein